MPNKNVTVQVKVRVNKAALAEVRAHIERVWSAAEVGGKVSDAEVLRYAVTRTQAAVRLGKLKAVTK